MDALAELLYLDANWRNSGCASKIVEMEKAKMGLDLWLGMLQQKNWDGVIIARSVSTKNKNHLYKFCVFVVRLASPYSISTPNYYKL